MKRIIFSNSLKLIKKLAANENNKIIYFLINYDKGTSEIKNFLDSRNNYKELNLDNYFKDKKSYLIQYTNFIAKLNKENGDSLYWWVLNFTNKNPISTGLCNQIFQFLCIVNFLEKENDPEVRLLIITDSVDLLKQTKIWAKNRNVKVTNAIKTKFNFKKIIKRYTPLAIIFVFVRMFIFKFLARLNCRFILDKTKEYSVILSLINHQSFSNDGHYRDAYFGELPMYLNKNNIPFLIFGEILFPPYVEILKKSGHSKELLVFSKEYFVYLRELFLCLIPSLTKYVFPVRLKDRNLINGVDPTYLITESIREDCSSTKFFSNLCFFYSVKSLVKNFQIDKFYYPFENRPFEKMVILALREFSPQTKIIGYQHASISQRHTNFFQGREEVKITPMPDLIVTMGEITKEILWKDGNFPKELIKVGCALRQHIYKGEPKKRKEKIVNILVVLATNIEEYVKVIKFLNSAFEKNNQYKIWIRPHPVFPLEEAIGITGQPRFKFHKSDKESLEECYNWADLVLYVHSTLSLESLSRGIPVVNIKIDDCLDPDPLFNFYDFKWSVENPNRLIETIQLIDSVSQEDFLERQKKAKDYTEKYIYPASENNLEVFLNV